FIVRLNDRWPYGVMSYATCEPLQGNEVHLHGPEFFYVTAMATAENSVRLRARRPAWRDLDTRGLFFAHPELSHLRAYCLCLQLAEYPSCASKLQQRNG